MRLAACTAVAMLFLSAVFQAALAQQAQPFPGAGPMMQGGTGREFAPEQFSETKARILKMLEERKARLEQEKTCVQTANSMEELQKCRPRPPMGGPGGMQGGPGRQRPLGGGMEQQR